MSGGDNKNTFQLFEKSLKSVEEKESIGSDKIEIAELIIENYCEFVHVIIDRKGNEYARWLVHDSEDFPYDDEDLEPVTIGDAHFTHYELESKQASLYHEDRLTGALSLIDYLLQVFSGSIKHATFINGTLPNARISQFVVDCFRLDSLKQCTSVCFFEKGKSLKSMVDGVLDLSTGLKRLDLRCSLPDDWSNPKVLKLDILISWPSEWFTTSDLLTVLDCECAQINETNLDCRAFKAFMLKWQMGENSRLKVLEVSFDGNWDRFDTRGLENLHEWNPEERDGHYPDLLGKPESDWFNCEFAHDIERNDGLLATFWRREQSFHFVVWHDRHPIATLQPKPEQLVRLEPDQFICDE